MGGQGLFGPPNLSVVEVFRGYFVKEYSVKCCTQRIFMMSEEAMLLSVGLKHAPNADGATIHFLQKIPFQSGFLIGRL